MNRKFSVLILALFLALAGAGVIHAQDASPTPDTGIGDGVIVGSAVPTVDDVVVVTVPAPEATVAPTADTVEVPVPGDSEDNSGTVIVTYDAFSNIFKMILGIILAGAALSLGTIALLVRQMRQDKDVVEAARSFRDKQPEAVQEKIDELSSLLRELSLFLDATKEPTTPPQG